MTVGRLIKFGYRLLNEGVCFIGGLIYIVTLSNS